MRESGLIFYFFKNRRSMYILSDNVPWEVYYVWPLMIFGPIQEPCWTLNQAIFLKSGPSQFHEGRRHYKERCGACIPTLNHIKNQYQAPTRFSEDRVYVKGILNIGRTWTKQNNEFL